MKRKVFLWVCCGLFAIGCAAAADSASNDDEYFIVETEGIGKNRVEAIEQAWLEAIRSSVGMMINVSTEIHQDEISESIIAHSRGLVEKYEVVMADDSQADAGIYTVKLKAWVRKDILSDGLTYVASEGQEIAFSMDDLKDKDSLDPNSAESLDSGQSTQEKQDREAGLLLYEFLKKYPSRSFVSLSIADKPKLAKDKKDTLQLELDLTFNSDLYFNQFLPESKDIFKQIAKESKHGYYRDPAVIDAIRKIPMEGNTGNNSVFVNAVDKNGCNVSIPDRKNTFSYSLYSLAEATLKSYSEHANQNLQNSNKLEYTVKFLGSDGDEVFEYRDAVQYRAFMQEGKIYYNNHNERVAFSETEIMAREIFLLSPNATITIHENPPNLKSVSSVKRNDSQDYLALNVVEKYVGTLKALRVQYGIAETGWLYMDTIARSYNKNELGFVNSSFLNSFSFYPSLITNAGIECEKNRFGIEFIMPEEVLPEIQSMKIEVLE